MSAELALLGIATAGAGVAAVFAILCFLRTQQLPGALTAQSAAQILRAETDIVRSTVEDQARGLRQELGCLNGSRKNGFVVTVSMRALKVARRNSFSGLLKSPSIRGVRIASSVSQLAT